MSTFERRARLVGACILLAWCVVPAHALSSDPIGGDTTANCETSIQKVTFDFTDPQLTKVTVRIDFAGDCPIQLKRVYEKSFPARIPAVEIMTMEEGVKDYLLW